MNLAMHHTTIHSGAEERLGITTSKPLRVLQVSDAFPPALGGLEYHVATLSRELAEAGADVSVATLDYPDAPEHEETSGYRVFRLKGATRHLRRFATDKGHYFHPTVPDPPLVWRLQRLINRLRPDVIHVHGWILASCLPVRRPAHTALVVTLHEYGAACVKKTYTQVPTGCPTGPGLTRCVSCAQSTYGLAKSAALTVGLQGMWPANRSVDRWISISKAVADGNEVALRSDPSRMDIIPTFVPNGIASIASAPSFELPHEPFLLFVGAMGPHKGLNTLLEARRNVGSVPLVVLGTPRADSPDVSEPGVFAYHNVPRAEVMSVWKAAAVGVIPSVWPEPLGQVAVECLSVGTPAIVSNTGGLVDVVRHEVEGLVVPPGDVSALTAAITRLLSDRELRDRLGAAGPSRAREFEIGSVLTRLMASYEAALADRRKVRSAA